MGVISVYDESGKRLASGGDGPLPVDVGAVQVSSRTQGDPHLEFKVPEGVHRLTVAVEDLAQRGGRSLRVSPVGLQSSFDIEATITTPYVNIPDGGTALVNVKVERRATWDPFASKPRVFPKASR